MAGKKNKCVVCVASNLTDTQAHNLVNAFAKGKNKIAPSCRTIAAVTTIDGVGKLLQRSWKKIETR